jgi:hypothetical protein
MATTILQIMQSRLGIAEIRGKKNNPIIVGWFKDVGHAEITDDETSYCSAALGSAALEVGLPIPPHNICLMARSWLTWGVEVPKDGKAIQAAMDEGYDVVAVWPRGDPQGWQGHVNVVEKVVSDGRDVVCVGANQATGKGYDGVTRSAPRAVSQALGFRRSVPPTIPALRLAGSSEVKQGDLVQSAGTVATTGSIIWATIQSAFGPVEIPQFKALPEGLSWWQSVIGGVNALWKLVIAHPWLVGTLIASLVFVAVGHRIKARRLEKHKAGVPLSSQVAA